MSSHCLLYYSFSMLYYIDSPQTLLQHLCCRGWIHLYQFYHHHLIMGRIFQPTTCLCKQRFVQLCCFNQIWILQFIQNLVNFRSHPLIFLYHFDSSIQIKLDRIQQFLWISLWEFLELTCILYQTFNLKYHWSLPWLTDVRFYKIQCYHQNNCHHCIQTRTNRTHFYYLNRKLLSSNLN